MAENQREEVLNVVLAEQLAARGIDAAPETVQKRANGKGRGLPDVLIEYRGMRIVIEGKFESSAQATETVADQAKERISSGIAQIALAVQYPAALRSTAFSRLPEQIEASTLRYSVFSEVDNGEWHEGGVSAVLDEIRRAHERMCNEDVVQQAAESIRGCLDGVSRLFASNASICEELSKVLGIGKPGKEDSETKRRRIDTTTKIAALTLANAFIFQEQLAASGVRNVISLRDLLRQKDVISKTIDTWEWICNHINYVPIFRLASDILARVPARSSSNGAVRVLAEKAIEVSGNEAALRHDLMGRIYHYLLHEAKYLGTYYTSVPAATILGKLALQPEKWSDLKFDNERSLEQLRIVDLTCGTGTLLMAACQALSDNFIVANARNREEITQKRLAKLHAVLMESVMHGYDVLPSAIHLTASTLSLLAPEVLFHQLHLYSMPLSVKDGRPYLGSLEFLEQAKATTQFTLFDAETTATEPRRYTKQGLAGSVAEVPETDLFIMNPPFTRSVGDNLLFGNLPEDQRAEMQKELKARVERGRLSASITAGLGSVFVAMADKYLKRGGRLAFVLPGATATGVAWEDTRLLIQEKYHLEYVIVSHEPGRWNFSENTELSELMFIARKLEEGQPNADLETTFVNLWRNPANPGDALAVARLIRTTQPAGVVDRKENGVAGLTELGRKYGEVVNVPMKVLKQGWWPTAFAQTELSRLAFGLWQGKLTLPGVKKTWDVPLVPLYQVAELGPDRRDIHDGFTPVTTKTPYKCFWNHDATKTLSMAQQPNMYLSPRSKPAPGRSGIRDIGLLWPKAGGLLFSESSWLITQRLCAIVLDTPVLSNTWWPVRLRKPDRRKEKALALWQNSTLGTTTLIMSRVPSKGAWIKFRKPGLHLLPVLNVDALTERQLNDFAAKFDHLAKWEVQAFSKMAEDDVRTAIDLAVTSALDLPDITALRDMLGREPVVTDRSLFVEDRATKEVEAPQMQLLFA
ncbi:MAG TPA: hypothetical protein VE085_03720 [Burkholderiales bacterium]|nr:hypothetical protein [Burkholderiales bacterium]